MSLLFHQYIIYPTMREREREREREGSLLLGQDRAREHGEPRREKGNELYISAHAAAMIDTSGCSISTSTVQHHMDYYKWTKFYAGMKQGLNLGEGGEMGG